MSPACLPSNYHNHPEADPWHPWTTSWGDGWWHFSQYGDGWGEVSPQSWGGRRGWGVST